MRKLLCGLAAGAVGLFLTGAAEADGGRHSRESVSYREREVRYHDGPGYRRQSPVRFEGGHYYRGRNHDHWTHRVWDQGQRRHHYYDGRLKAYFYWHEPAGCYYPVTYGP